MKKTRQRRQKQSRATQPPTPPRSFFPQAELTPEEQGEAIKDSDKVEATITALEADDGGEGVGGD